MIRQETAETIALQALTWLVGQDALLEVFLEETGASAADLRKAAGDAEFLGSVLDFLLIDDPILMEVSDALGLPYDGLMQARSALPGGVNPAWT